ncbi:MULTISPECIES: hypothetical protein [Thermoanaerobacterium]|uniref:RAMP superfamily protein probably involved in DNA repair n=3 Tax=Thermoanaerobacterium TaxID=28895 RepID=L0IR47_THETR|nr:MULTISPECIES: hypothetical protein [Thermoanaerobacterium]AFK94277.1 hypothetical protein Tsac_2730 [Thermoanaerobacterium saccharolyticum JW/SL-YS485]AGB20452.1 hypothetical protein Thethe_02905 [Thermoanaerobacterium thermosaccharolyticum M0795]ETO39070.1 hypothetical protein V518_0777 [Thermoanaerobacterium aotearoense SCUT27]
MLNVYGKVVALSPITHGSIDVDLDDKTNKGEIRKIPFCVEDNAGEATTIFIPVVSGNSIKGLSRREFAQKIRETLGKEEFDKLDNEVKYLIAAGGANTNASPSNVKQEVYAELRQKLPFLSVLGGVYRGHYFRGLLVSDFMIPITKEILSLYADKLVTVKLENNPLKYPSVSDLFTNEYIGYTRFKVEGVDEDEIMLESTSGEDKKLEIGNQMIYYTKQIPTGTLMIHGFHINKASDIEISCFYAFLKTFIEVGHVGGNISKGHGQIKCEYYLEDGTVLDDNTLNNLSEPFWTYLKNNKDKVLEQLSNLKDILQAKVKDKNNKSKKEKNEDEEE